MSAVMSAAAPASPWLAHAARIREIRPEAPGVSTYDLTFEDAALAAGYGFAPGQFNMLYLPGVGEVAISISSDPSCTDTLDHTIRLVGSVTRGVDRLKAHALVGLRGPFGRGWPLQAMEGKDVVIVAGGIGLAPLRPANRFGSQRVPAWPRR